MRSRTLMASAGALALTLLSGCLGTYTGDPEARGPRNIEPRTRPDLAREVRWERAYLGAGTQALLLGYIKHSTPESGMEGTRWIYDTRFRLVGWVSPFGRVTRHHPDTGATEDEGNYELKYAVLTVFGYDEEKTIVVKPMEAPRG